MNRGIWAWWQLEKIENQYEAREISRSTYWTKRRKWERRYRGEDHRYNLCGPDDKGGRLPRDTETLLKSHEVRRMIEPSKVIELYKKQRGAVAVRIPLKFGEEGTVMKHFRHSAVYARKLEEYKDTHTFPGFVTESDYMRFILDLGCVYIDHIKSQHPKDEEEEQDTLAQMAALDNLVRSAQSKASEAKMLEMLRVMDEVMKVYTEYDAPEEASVFMADQIKGIRAMKPNYVKKRLIAHIKKKYPEYLPKPMSFAPRDFSTDPNSRPEYQI